MKIGEFSRLSGLSVDTLYHYEKTGVLPPAGVDTATGYRRYDAAQLLAANKLRALKDAGFTLKEIADIQSSNPPAALLIEMLEYKAKAMAARLSEETGRLERLQTHIFLIKNGGIPMANEITIKRVEPILVASMRRTCEKEKFDAELEAMWTGVNRHIDIKGGRRTIPCMMIYHRGWVDTEGWDETPGADPLDVEVAEPVIAPIDGGDAVKVYALPMAEKVACIVHEGPYSTIPQSNVALFRWILQNGYRARGTIREIYHKGDWVTDNPEEYITEIQIPLQESH